VPKLHLLRVFVNEDGEWGNPLAVFLDGAEVPVAARQRVAADLGLSETVFVDDCAEGRMHIHTPTVELPFAGHPSVGTAWLLRQTETPVEALRPPAGRTGVHESAGVTYVTAPPEWAPPFEYRELESPAQVRTMAPPPGDEGNVYAWAWIDEAAGTLRARSFVPEAGIAEDEATGSAALGLCGRLSRHLVIHQGRGSLLLARPAADGRVEVGGNVRLDEVRNHSL